jgi:predicted GIY-YIG superfamily endonuclease
MASQNFVLSKPRFQGAAKGKIAMFYAYILRCSDDSYYVGSSDDPDRRLIEHNQGKGSDWTAARRPVTLVWIEEHPTLSSARQRENQIKRWNREKKDALVGGSLRLRSGRA